MAAVSALPCSHPFRVYDCCAGRYSWPPHPYIGSHASCNAVWAHYTSQSLDAGNKGRQPLGRLYLETDQDLSL